MAMEGIIIITERSGHYSFYTVNFHTKFLSTLSLYVYVVCVRAAFACKFFSVLLTDFMTGTYGFWPQKTLQVMLSPSINTKESDRSTNIIF